MINPIQVEIVEYEFGWYVQPYRMIYGNTKLIYCSDTLVADLLSIVVTEYRQILVINGAVAINNVAEPANGITYFLTQAEAYAAGLVVVDLINQAYENNTLFVV